MRTVIIGNGRAAVESVIALRRGGYDSEAHLFSDSIFPAFNPALLTYFIAGKIGLEDFFPCGRDFYNEHGVKLHLGSKVEKLDAQNRTVENAAGVKMSYDNCVVCSGASPVVPKEYQGGEVYTIRSVHDAIALKKQISKGKKALVVGASHVGVKVVDALAGQGVEVGFTDTCKHVFPLSAYAGCASLIERALEEKGVRMYLGAGAPDLSKYDFFVVCAGIKPNIDFIDKTQVNADNGILVDRFMRTNREGLYAAGDAALVRGEGSSEYVASGLWASARRMGRTAGRNIAGKNEVCGEIIRHNNTRFFDIDFASIGDIFKGDDIFEMESAGKYCVIAWKDRRLTGINLLNMPEISGILKSRLLGSRELSNIALSKVFSRYPPIREAFLKRGALDEHK